LSFAPDGRHIATGAHDRIARVWEVATGREVARVVHESEVERVAFDAAGRYLLTTSGELLGLSDHVARVSPWRPGDLIEEICGRLTRNLSVAEWHQYLEGEAYRATCPDIPGHTKDMLSRADELASSGQRGLAKRGFKAAIEAVGRERDVQLANSVCWFGAVDGFADIVLPACDRAVSLAEESAVAPYRDSRGVARALGGDRAGAIEDFKFFISWAKGREASAQEMSQRQAWVATLQSGGNPFDAETLKALRNQ
jgi:hypothetical protein